MEIVSKRQYFDSLRRYKRVKELESKTNLSYYDRRFNSKTVKEELRISLLSYEKQKGINYTGEKLEQVREKRNKKEILQSFYLLLKKGEESIDKLIELEYDKS